MRRRAPLATAIALGVLGVFAACSSFEVIGPSSTNDPPDASTPSDGAADVAFDVVRPPSGALGCTPARALDCDPVSGCTLTLLFKPAEVEWPFGIVTDAEKVYWVTQTNTQTDSPAYDGAGAAKIHWISKRGTRERKTMTGGQVRTTAAALDGDSVYWPARAENGTSWVLRRGERNCANESKDNCGTSFFVALGEEPVVDLRSTVPGHMVAATSKGTVILIDLASKQALRFPVTGDLPTLATTELSAFAASGYVHGVAEVVYAQMSSRPYDAVPDAGKQSGIGLLATDCTTLFGLRTPESTGDRDVFALGGASPRAVGTISRGFDPKTIAADARHLYVGGSAGLYVKDIAAGTPFAHRDGPEIWRIAVDDDGVYYANHTTGELYMLAR